MIEPSNTERSEWPECTAEYVSSLEAECELNRNCKLAVVIAKERIAELEAERDALEIEKMRAHPK